jgi:two-component system, NtrC family, sensor kinase
MASHVSHPSPLYVLLAVAKAGGRAFWSTLTTLPRRLFQRHWHSLRMKFIVVIVALQLALMGVVTVVMERHQRAGILEQARLRALSLALSLAALSEGDLFSYNFIKLEQTAEKAAADDQDILYVIAHLHDGRVAVFSGRPDLQETQLSDPISQRALQATAPLVQELLGVETTVRGYDVAIPVFAPHSAKKWGTIRLGFSLRRVYEGIHHTRLTLLWLSLGAVVCGTSLAIMLALWVSRPIRQLVAGVQAFTRGAYDYPLQVDTRDEIGYLASTFAQMRTSLQRHLTSLAEEKRRLEESNCRLQQMQQQLIQSERLATVGRMAAWVGHEIHNPLSIITTAVRIIKDQSREDSPTIGRLRIIDEEVSRIARILRELLDFSPASPTQEVVDVNAVIHSLEPLLAPTLQSEQIALRVLLEPELPQVCMASDRLKQVLFNIIRNAEEAMPGGGDLVIQTTQQGDRIQLRITDTGGGIPPEHLGQVFAPFFTTKGHEGGKGLGLAISYGLVAIANGHIDVESEVGQGSTFRVSLPMCKLDGGRSDGRPPDHSPYRG